jgi:hypothetical protein
MILSKKLLKIAPRKKESLPLLPLTLPLSPKSIRPDHGGRGEITFDNTPLIRGGREDSPPIFRGASLI